MIYDLLAPFYDEANRDIDYVSWADFFEFLFGKYLKSKPELILDLACGTGSMTLELAKRGYDMTGVDLSPEMLDIARERAEKERLSERCLWLLQDMNSFELYGTVGAVVCCLDSINHLTGTASLKKTFDLVHNYLDPDGLFIFDINGKRKFEEVYANETYTVDTDDDFCIWQNDYDEKRGVCDFYITVFHKNADGTYTRYDDEQREKMFTVQSVKNMLLKCGFEFIGAYSDFEMNEGNDSCNRIYIAARAKKDEYGR